MNNIYIDKDGIAVALIADNKSLKDYPSAVKAVRGGVVQEDGTVEGGEDITKQLNWNDEVKAILSGDEALESVVTHLVSFSFIQNTHLSPSLFLAYLKKIKTPNAVVKNLITATEKAL